MKPSSIRSSLTLISPGGWVTMFLALVWSAGVQTHFCRGAIACFGDPIALYLTYPLADLNPIGGTISRTQS
jgi:hypothetical protein